MNFNFSKAVFFPSKFAEFHEAHKILHFHKLQASKLSTREQP